MNRKIMIMVMALSLTAAMTACGVTPVKQEPAAKIVSSAQEVSDTVTSSTDEKTVVTKEESAYHKDFENTQIKTTQAKVTHTGAAKIKAADIRDTDQNKKTSYFEGIVKDVQKDFITVTGKTLSVTFTKSSDTEVIKGTPEIGDDVIITYTGTIDNTSFASGIEVVKKADHERYILTGKIEQSDGTYLKVNTGDATYIFDMDNNTIVSGGRLAPGNKVDVVYVNRLDQEPLAISISCTEKDAPETAQAVLQEISVQEVRQDTKPVQEKKMQVEMQVKEKPEKNVETVTENDLEITDVPEEETSGTSTEDPADTQDPAGTEDPADTEDQVITEDPVVTEEPQPEEPVITEEPAPAVEPAEESEEQPQEELKIEKSGTIIAWKDGSTCTIQFDDGETMELALTPDTSIAGGYTPETDDVVNVIFRESDSSVLKIQLLERPEKEQAVPEED